METRDRGGADKENGFGDKTASGCDLWYAGCAPVSHNATKAHRQLVNSRLLQEPAGDVIQYGPHVEGTDCLQRRIGVHRLALLPVLDAVVIDRVAQRGEGAAVK